MYLEQHKLKGIHIPIVCIFVSRIDFVERHNSLSRQTDQYLIRLSMTNATSSHEMLRHNVNTCARSVIYKAVQVICMY